MKHPRNMTPAERSAVLGAETMSERERAVNGLIAQAELFAKKAAVALEESRSLNATVAGSLLDLVEGRAGDGMKLDHRDVTSRYEMVTEAHNRAGEELEKLKVAIAEAQRLCG